MAFAILTIPKPGQSQVAAANPVNNFKGISLAVAQGAVGVVTDFFIFCLPLPVLWQLQLPPKKKVGVSAIFMTGLL